jgi:hypothetical protein
MKKIENFMLTSKKQTCLSDKMPPKKVKIKNKKWDIAKLEHIIYNFLRVFCHKDKFAFLNSA